ncbi:hypothetical protein Acr_26g0000160 [Actinidia rufa]|uniref:Uncharacterized protein n=1 Tax=Actinidia rufa TaxID=165716 RepID=A0A7J0H0Z2_9ERIC|nr:hypothetical protein Acr_26g0000160 [Actinidia rufa]
MASHSSNCSTSRETRRKTPHAPKTLGCKGGKLSEDAQRATEAPSGLMRPTETIISGRTKARIREPTLPAWEGLNKKQCKMHVSVDNHTNSKTVAMSKQKRSLEWTRSGVNLRDALNAKQSREGDLRAKINGQKAVDKSKEVPAGSVIRAASIEQREVAPKY